MDSKLILCNENVSLTPDEKQQRIEIAAEHYGNYLTALGFDWKNDPNMDNTPMRVAKMMMNEVCSGNFSESPKVTSFPNDQPYQGMIIQKNIKIQSTCAHHNLPIIGKAHIAIIPGKEGRLIGLSKFNRITEFYARRLQIQENLTEQIHQHISQVCESNRGVAVIIEASHGCVSCRGINHDSEMTTSRLSGYFFDNTIGTRTEFFSLIK